MAAPSRRGVLALAAVGAVVGASELAGRRLAQETAGGRGLAAVPYAVGLSPFGRLVAVGAGGRAGDPRGRPELVEASRVVADPAVATEAVSQAVNAERTWLAMAAPPLSPLLELVAGGPGARLADVRASQGAEAFERALQAAELGDLARYALLDLRVMLRPRGVLLARWAPDRGGVLAPRVAAIGAAALAASGFVDDALDVLGMLARIQRPDGRFAARHAVAERGRGAWGTSVGRAEGTLRRSTTGWVLWAMDQVISRTSWEQALDVQPELRTLFARSFLSITSTLGSDGLPPRDGPVRPGLETPAELATAAPMLAGLRAAVNLEQNRRGSRVQAFALADAGIRLEEAVIRSFGPVFPAVRGGRSPAVDVTVLLPPFAPVGRPAPARAARAADRALVRPDGLFGPGRTGVSTVDLARFALADAFVDVEGVDRTAPQRCRDTLLWLARHRTAPGSLPGAVRFDGKPTGFAPSVEASAFVLLALSGLWGPPG